LDDIAKLAISIARKMNALIFLVPEDIVDVRAKLVRVLAITNAPFLIPCSSDSHLCRKSHEPVIVSHIPYALNQPLVCPYYGHFRLLFLYYGCIAIRQTR